MTPSGDLAFSVMLFAIVGGLALGILMFLRFFMGGELGGSKLRQWSTAGVLFGLWMMFLILSGLRAYGHI